MKFRGQKQRWRVVSNATQVQKAVCDEFGALRRFHAGPCLPVWRRLLVVRLLVARFHAEALLSNEQRNLTLERNGFVKNSLGSPETDGEEENKSLDCFKPSLRCVGRAFRSVHEQRG